MLDPVFELNLVKALVAQHIEFIAVPALEKIRDDSFYIGIEKHRYFLEHLAEESKEIARKDYSMQLEHCSIAIDALWETMIQRNSFYQIAYDNVMRVCFVLTIIFFLLSFYVVVVVLSVIFIILFLIRQTGKIYPAIMYRITSSNKIMNRLLAYYQSYGEFEAMLFCLDYPEDYDTDKLNRHYIYATKHKSP